MQSWSPGRRAAAGVRWSASLGALVGCGELVVRGWLDGGALHLSGVLGSGVAAIGVNAVTAALLAFVGGVFHAGRNASDAALRLSWQITFAVGGLLALHLSMPTMRLFALGREVAGWATAAIIVASLGALFVNVRYGVRRVEAGVPWPVSGLAAVGGGAALAVLLAAAAVLAGDPGGRHALVGDPSALVITVDGLPDRWVGAQDPAGRPITPSLDALAEEGVRFEQAITPSSDPVAAAISLWTGLHPLRHGVLSGTHRLAPGLPSAAQRYRDEGYATVAIHGSLPLSETGWERAFHRVDDARSSAAPLVDRLTVVQWALGLGGSTAWSSRDDLSTLDRWRAVARSLGDRPALVWLHLGASEVQEGEGAASEERARERARSLDAVVGEALRVLDAAGRTDDTLVVVAGLRGDPRSAGLEEGSVRVPLIVRMPGVGEPGARVPHQVRLYDIAPTLVAWSDLQAEDRMEGIDLTGFLDGRRRQSVSLTLLGRGLEGAPVLGVRQPGVKVIHAPEPGWTKAFDLQTDPEETRDVSDAQEELVRQALGILKADARALQGLSGEVVTPPRRARLAALGYP